MMHNVVFALLLLYHSLVVNSRYYCPPANFVPNSRLSNTYLKIAIITSIHGQLWSKVHSWGPFWTEYYHGDLLARNLFNHVGILGVDKIVMGVFYNETLYPEGPTVEDIYPAASFCVADWYKLGVLDWRPLPYGGPVRNWPIGTDGKPSEERNYYKTLRAYNPLYAGIVCYSTSFIANCCLDIRNQYDWVFVMDPDEQLTPLNFNFSGTRSNWCGLNKPSLVSRIIHQMLITASNQKLSSYGVMMNATRDKVISQSCDFGMSHNEKENQCKPISSIYLPVHLWMRPRKDTSEHAFPTLRSKHAGCYWDRLKSEPKDGQEEWWKSVYQTKYSSLLEGRSLHENPVKNVFTILAPRSFHGGLSLELVHQRAYSRWTRETKRLMTSDQRLVALYDSYLHCMKNLS